MKKMNPNRSIESRDEIENAIQNGFYCSHSQHNNFPKLFEAFCGMYLWVQEPFKRLPEIEKRGH